jgi:molecular chaperone DnaK
MAENADLIVGIDLGTTNSEIAVYRNGQAEVLADDAGRTMTPSVVGFDQDGALLVGEEARNQFLLWPDRTVRSIKRRMGSEETVAVAGRHYAPQEISAMILKHLKEIAERRLGQRVARAVITVPAYFSDAQRQATRAAGEIAGLEVVRIINEPTAAALVYEAGVYEAGVYEAGHRMGKRVLVYDLGGGTFDVSVVRIEQGVVEVLASHGNNHLGGDDFDQKVVTHLLDHLKIKHGVDISARPQAMARISRAAETAKRHLSDHPFAQIDEEYIAERDGAPVHLSLELSRHDYEAMIEPFIEETLAAVHTALKGANLTASQVEKILLVGGVTRTPMIRERLKTVFGLDPRGDVSPDLCVAMGAALQGAAIAGETIAAVLVDVTPYTFGTSVLGFLHGEFYPWCFAPVIPKNTPIPVRRSEVFTTSTDNQKIADLSVYQGEDPDARRNIELGKFKIEGLSAAPRGNQIIFELALDRDGILHVSAKEKKTGLEHRTTIDKAMDRYGAGAVTDAQQRIGALFGSGVQVQDVQDVQVQHDAVQGTDDELTVLLTKASARLNEAGEEDRAEITTLIEAIKDAKQKNDTTGLQTHRKHLEDILFYLQV